MTVAMGSLFFATNPSQMGDINNYGTVWSVSLAGGHSEFHVYFNQ
jgi:hypothetical protein